MSRWGAGVAFTAATWALFGRGWAVFAAVSLLAVAWGRRPTVNRSMLPPGYDRIREPIPRWKRDWVLARDGHRCRYCRHRAAQGKPLHVDHIWPVARGGTNRLANLQALCPPCNLRKGAKAPPAHLVPKGEPTWVG
jgi:hypothetical protein